MDIINSKAYNGLLLDLKSKIRQAQHRASLAVNKELVILYWQIGNSILNQEEAKGGWGSKVIDKLAQDLKKEFPEIKGFSVRNLKYMRALAEHYTDFIFVQQLAAQLPWMHNCVLLDKVKDAKQRVFYIESTIKHGWSRSVLVHQIESRLYNRQAQVTKTHNYHETLPQPQSELSHELLKDPYKFLDLVKKLKKKKLKTL
jgi:predicted nuclease of restriction endonuclease-like (RecB) superfamily